MDGELDALKSALTARARKAWRVSVGVIGSLGVIWTAIAAFPPAAAVTDPIQIADHAYVQDTVSSALDKVTKQLPDNAAVKATVDAAVKAAAQKIEDDFMVADSTQAQALTALTALVTANTVRTLQAQYTSLQTASYSQGAQVSALKAAADAMPGNVALANAYQTAQDNLDNIRKMMVKTQCLIDHGGDAPAGVC